MLLVLILLQFRVLSSFAESAFYPYLRDPLPESASAIRIPVPRFIPTPVVWRQTNYILYFN
jgi:hypothetical protein